MKLLGFCRNLETTKTNSFRIVWCYKTQTVCSCGLIISWNYLASTSVGKNKINQTGTNTRLQIFFHIITETTVNQLSSENLNNTSITRNMYLVLKKQVTKRNSIWNTETKCDDKHEAVIENYLVWEWSLQGVQIMGTNSNQSSLPIFHCNIVLSQLSMHWM
jgi:hypothetical protein